MARPRYYPGARQDFVSRHSSWGDTILEQQENEQHKLGRKIAMEEDWLRYGGSSKYTRALQVAARGCEKT